MEPDIEIETVAIQVNKYVAFLFPTMLIGIGVTLWLGIVSHNPALGYIGLAIFLVGPAVFNGQIRSFFTKKARVLFFADHLTVQMINEDTDSLETTDEIPYDDVASFRMGESGRDDSSYVSLRLADGRKYYYTFLQQKIGDSEGNVVANLQDYIRNYNSRPGSGHVIVYLPSLLAGERGKQLLIGLSVMTVVAALIQLIVSPRMIAISLVSGPVLLILLFVQRQSDIAKVKAMGPPTGGEHSRK
jgi:hypothetical protein